MIHNPTPCWDDLYQQFLGNWPDEASAVGVLIGCSGGADSVALTRLIDQASRLRSASTELVSPPIVIAHFNHRLRGEESDGDESSVARLCEILGRRFVSKNADASSPASDEASLRSQRRQFFVETAKQAGCRYISVAHTSDDQAETVLHNALRGTGAAGLAGMKRASAIDEDLVIRRPLLGIRRQLIRDALSDLGQPWREDTSNCSSAYTRNWLRNEVLPLIRERLPHADEALTRMASNQCQIDDFMTRLSHQWLEAFVSSSSDSEKQLRIRIQIPQTKGANHGWCHGNSLAREPAVVTAACQQLYTKLGFGCADMKQEHWVILVDAILENDCQKELLRSRGHLPGHIEIRTSRTHVELSSVRRV